MSKNHDRYKEDLSHLDIEELDELETQKFERFHPKKKADKKPFRKGKKEKHDSDESLR